MRGSGSGRPGKADILTHLVLLVLLAISLPAGAQTATAAKSFRDCPDCPEMVTIPPGTFMMGASKEEAEHYRQNATLLDRLAPTSLTRAQPQHSVVFSQAFAIGKYPVTRAEFARFIDETRYYVNLPCPVVKRLRRGRGWSNPGYTQVGRDPIVCVSWDDANAYVAWLNKKVQSSGGAAKAGFYRLPSEAEYEYAARGGTTTKRWWGDDVGWNKADCNGCGTFYEGPEPVGLDDPNPYGVYDILGNVWEWTQDCWNKTYEHAPADGSAWLTGDCGRRVMRGGSWASSPYAVRSDVRSRIDHDSADTLVGFRVAKSLQ